MDLNNYRAIFAMLAVYFLVDAVRVLRRAVALAFWKPQDQFIGKPMPKDAKVGFEATIMFEKETFERIRKMQQRCELAHPLLVVNKSLNLLGTLHNLADDGYDHIVASNRLGEAVEVEI